MALISINGVDLPTPTEYVVSIMDISKAERNANGNMIIERINTKKKIEIKYAYLTGSDLANVLNAISAVFFDVNYLDPQENFHRTASFYCGDRNVGMIDFLDNQPRYKDLSFNLIER